MIDRHEISFTLNGAQITRRVESRLNLVDFLRGEMQLTGTHVGCEYGSCGACSVRVDGQVVRGCLILAVQVDGKEVETVEGLTQSGEVADFQQEFLNEAALQCGFCTPGMLMSASELSERKPTANRDEIRDFISGNYCRCTGYQSVVTAIEKVLNARRRDAVE